MKYARVSSVVLLLLGVHPAQAQQTIHCRVLCTPEFKVEPVASGLPKKGDTIEGRRYVDDASPWSFSLVFVLPVAPF